MSDPLASLSPALQAHLLALRELSAYGVLAVEIPEGSPPVYIWWGDRSKAGWSAMRIVGGIQMEEDEGTEEVEETEDDAQFDLFKPIQLPEAYGNYI